MKESFKIRDKKSSAPENLEDQKHAAFQMAMDEEERIRKEIDNVLTTTSDRKETEKIILQKYAPLMDEAMKKSRQALQEWLDSIQKL